MGERGMKRETKREKEKEQGGAERSVYLLPYFKNSIIKIYHT